MMKQTNSKDEYAFPFEKVIFENPTITPTNEQQKVTASAFGNILNEVTVQAGGGGAIIYC